MTALRPDEMFERLVLPLKAHRWVDPAFDLVEETANSFRPFPCEFENIDIVILEDIFIFKPAFVYHFDLNIWIECSIETAFARTLSRAQELLSPGETKRVYKAIYFRAQRAVCPPVVTIFCGPQISKQINVADRSLVQWRIQCLEYNSCTLRRSQMKECPACRRVYADESLSFCLDDGSRLSAESLMAEPPTVPFWNSDESLGADNNEPLQQDIRYCETDDGVQIAYSAIGNGPVLIRVLGHFTHLEMEWEWPDLRILWEQLAQRFTVVRYDGRGIGLSGKYKGDFTEETRQRDLEAVLKAINASDVNLLGISEGGWTSATYATQHPGRTSRLIFYGSYCRGAKGRDNYDPEEDQALITLIRKGWGRDTPAFRQLFTSHFFRPDADPRLIAHFNEMQRASADAETAARYWESIHDRGDGRELFRHIQVPTLVIHCQDDTAVDADEGRLLASTVPGARLVLLPSGTHYFPTDREVIKKVVGAINRFVFD